MIIVKLLIVTYNSNKPPTGAVAEAGLAPVRAAIIIRTNIMIIIRRRRRKKKKKEKEEQ